MASMRQQLHWISSGWGCTMLFSAALLLTPWSFQLSYGQDGVQLKVEHPLAGEAPRPTPPAAIAAPTPPPTPSEEHSEAPALPEAPQSEPSEEVPAQQAPNSGTDVVVESEVTTEDGFDLGSVIESTRSVPPTDEVVELSVPPTPSLYPEDLPNWIKQAPNFSGKVHFIAVGSEPVANPKKVDKALSVPLMAAVLDYLDKEVFNQRGVAEDLPITEDYVRRNLIANQAGEIVTLKTSSGEMYEKWVKLEITPEIRNNFVEMRRMAIQRSRMPVLGLGVLVVVGLLGASHLVLRRGDGLPASQPLQGENLVANNVPTKTKSGGIFAYILLLGSVFFLGAILVAAMLFVSVDRVERVTYPSEEVHERIREHLSELPIDSAHAPFTSGGNHQISQQLREGAHETIVIESNGQTIFERRLNK